MGDRVGGIVSMRSWHRDIDVVIEAERSATLYMGVPGKLIADFELASAFLWLHDEALVRVSTIKGDGPRGLQAHGCTWLECLSIPGPLPASGGYARRPKPSCLRGP